MVNLPLLYYISSKQSIRFLKFLRILSFFFSVFQFFRLCKAKCNKTIDSTGLNVLKSLYTGVIEIKFLQEEIKKHLKVPIKNIITKKSLSSTNTVLKSMAEEYADRTVLTAEVQTNGRGRTGNTFFSPKGGLYMSVLLKNSLPKDLLCITPAAACAVRRAIFETTKKSPLIKWVNDLYLNEKKICGILAETSRISKGGEIYCVLGIGINIETPPGGFVKEAGSAGALFEEGEAVPENLKNRLCAEILNNFFEILKEDKREYLSEYKKHSFLENKTLLCLSGEKSITGQYGGIDEDFNLILKTADGEEIKLSSGEVKIKNWS